MYLSTPNGNFAVSFGTAAVFTGATGQVGFQVKSATAAGVTPNVVRFAYDDIGEALYQDVHAVGAAPGDMWVLDVFEADELGPDHYAEQKPQLWDTRPVRAVAL